VETQIARALALHQHRRNATHARLALLFPETSLFQHCVKVSNRLVKLIRVERGWHFADDARRFSKVVDGGGRLSNIFAIHERLVVVRVSPIRQ